MRFKKGIASTMVAAIIAGWSIVSPVSAATSFATKSNGSIVVPSAKDTAFANDTQQSAYALLAGCEAINDFTADLNEIIDSAETVSFTKNAWSSKLGNTGEQFEFVVTKAVEALINNSSVPDYFKREILELWSVAGSAKDKKEILSIVKVMYYMSSRLVVNGCRTASVALMAKSEDESYRKYEKLILDGTKIRAEIQASWKIEKMQALRAADMLEHANACSIPEDSLEGMNAVLRDTLNAEDAYNTRRYDQQQQSYRMLVKTYASWWNSDKEKTLTRLDKIFDEEKKKILNEKKRLYPSLISRTDKNKLNAKIALWCGSDSVSYLNRNGYGQDVYRGQQELVKAMDALASKVDPKKKFRQLSVDMQHTLLMVIASSNEYSKTARQLAKAGLRTLKR